MNKSMTAESATEVTVRDEARVHHLLARRSEHNHTARTFRRECTQTQPSAPRSRRIRRGPRIYLQHSTCGPSSASPKRQGCPETARSLPNGALPKLVAGSPCRLHLFPHFQPESPCRCPSRRFAGSHTSTSPSSLGTSSRSKLPSFSVRGPSSVNGTAPRQYCQHNSQRRQVPRFRYHIVRKRMEPQLADTVHDRIPLPEQSSRLSRGS